MCCREQRPVNRNNNAMHETDESYKIDNVIVANLFEVRSRPLPARPQSTVEKQFPGVGERFLQLGPALPEDLHVTAILFAEGATGAAAYAALITALDTHNARRADGDTYSVKVHEREFVEMWLMDFAVTGPLIVFNPPEADQRAVAFPVRWMWRRMKGVAT
jgi:hypothetical protein